MLDSVAQALPQKLLSICVGVFLVFVAVGFALSAPHNRLSGRGEAPLPMKSLGNEPTLQIELARSENDLFAVLASRDLKRNLKDACIGNELDTYLVIPAYTGLLMSVGLMLAGGDQQWRTVLVLFALVVMPLATVSDWMENAGISATLRHFQHDGVAHAGDAVRISTPSLLKWTILAIVLLIYGLAACRRLRSWRAALSSMAVVAVTGTTLGALLVVTLIRYILERQGS